MAKTKTHVPKQGDYIYVDDVEGFVRGGKARALGIEISANTGKTIHWIYTNAFVSPFNWEYLKSRQKQLKAKFGNRRARHVRTS